MAHGDAREGRWRGNWWMQWVASTLHTTSEHGVSSITTADAHTSAASSWLNWRPRRFKWTRPFRRKTKSGFCACAITFQTQSTSFPLECLHGVYEDKSSFTFLELQLCCADTTRNLKQFCLQKKHRIPDNAIWLQSEISAYLRHQSMSNNPCLLALDLCAPQQQANISHNASPSYHKHKVRQNRKLGYKSGLAEKWDSYQ
jgi:hypothetical protein